MSYQWKQGRSGRQKNWNRFEGLFMKSKTEEERRNTSNF